MTRRRWIADEVRDGHAYLFGPHAAHLSRVLRVRVGQEFDVSAGDQLRRGRVLSVADDCVEFELGEILEAPSVLRIVVLLSVIKFDRMEWAIEKLTELSVASIVPLVARRTDARLAVAAGKRVERWRRIALEASEQSRRARPPEVAAPSRLKDLLTLESDCKLLLNESEVHPSVGEVLGSGCTMGSLALAVGPEGGWVEEEVKMLEGAGWKSVSLGETILRTETAAIVGVATVHALAGC
ncbi:MAG: RsmE family RNA methyltransferase [Candidatus Korobacteraceae bacterium]|jgi:16S rRNA (uracil1498-N3)-methyltransferase